MTFILAIVSIVLTAHADSCLNARKWMTADEYQEHFDKNVAKSCYPKTVEGKLDPTSGDLYKGEFVPFPKENFVFWSRHGAPKKAFDADNSAHSNNANLVWKQMFKNAKGEELFQAVWIAH